MTAPVVVYGASGYTGKLIMAHLARANVPFLATGRNAARLKEQIARVPELAKAQYEVAAVEHDADALTKVLRGAKIVYNSAGPFTQLGEPVIRAAINAGVHYLDVTGEVHWATQMRDRYAEQFAKKDLLFAPMTSYMFAAGNVAAELALEHHGVDSLDLLYFFESNTSIGSTKSFLTMCTRPQYYLDRGKLVQWPWATAYDVRVPDTHATYKALPWSGGAEPIWYEKDPRVQNVQVLISHRNRQMFGAVIDVLVDFEKKYRSLSPAEQDKITNQSGADLKQAEPEREDPDQDRSVISCVGRGNAGGVNVVLRGNSAYLQTGAMAAEACRRILDGRLLATGFQSPAKAFGARAIISAWAELGYLTWHAEAV